MIEQDKMVDTLSAWLKCESHTYDAHGVNAMLEIVLAEIRDMSVAVERIPGKNGLGDIAILRAGPPTSTPGILVISHLDTVHPPGTLEEALPIRREGDRLHGPGIYDMKGGVYIALQALKNVVRRQSSRRPVAFLLSPDEEIGSPTTRAVIEDMARSSEFALVMEPAREGGAVVTARKGVGMFDVHAEGHASHAGTHHQEGHSAIREAARVILRIEEMTDYSRGITTSIGLVSGGTARNTVPENCRFSVDLRVATPQDGAHCARTILGLTSDNPNVRLSITGGINRPPYERTGPVANLYERARTLARELGSELAEVPMTGGGSDGNFTAALGIATLDGLGIEGAGAHTLQEYGLISSIGPRIQLMARLLETL